MNSHPIRRFVALFFAFAMMSAGCQKASVPAGALPVGSAPHAARILFLHHSTGECVWNGGVAEWFAAYNAAHGTTYAIGEQAFPKESPYGWENFPYDYWNIWVEHAGPKSFRDEPTLEMLTPKYDVIVLKHCFPVSNIEADTGQPDVRSSDKRLESYKLQYAALKQKMRTFPQVKFVVWTGAALVQNETDEESAQRAQAFFDWVRKDWDEKGDNIFLWDFRQLETEGGLYLLPAYAAGDSHPNEEFSRRVAPLFAQRVVDVIEGRGDSGSLMGEGTAEATVALREEPPGEPSSTPMPVPEARPATTEAASPAEKPLVFDDAETPARCSELWGEGAVYVKDEGSNVVRLQFAKGEEEDWGEYGQQRVLFSLPGKTNLDIRPYRYLSLQMKADREMEVVLTLVTLPDPRGPREQPHFHFSAYLHPTQGEWKTVTLDLERLEPGITDEAAYKKAGSPARPNDLTLFRLSTSAKHAAATFLLDNVTFYGALPESLRETVGEP